FHFDVKLVSISKQSRDFKLKGLLRFFAASQKLSIEPYFGSSFHAGERQPHALIFIDAAGIAEMSTKAHAAGKVFQTSVATTTRHGHFVGSRQVGIRGLPSTLGGEHRPSQGLAFPGTAETDAMRIDEKLTRTHF